MEPVFLRDPRATFGAHRVGEPGETCVGKRETTTPLPGRSSRDCGSSGLLVFDTPIRAGGQIPRASTSGGAPACGFGALEALQNKRGHTHDNHRHHPRQSTGTRGPNLDIRLLKIGFREL